MNKTILVAYFVAITSLNLVAAEPSAFGAGNLDSSSPYGLTSSEKAVLQNKKNLKKIAVKSNNQANQVESLRERIDGLQSIVESLSRKSQKNKTELASLQLKNTEELKNSDEYEKRLGEVTQQNSLLIKEIKELVDNITNNYVTKKEFNKLVYSVNKFKDLVSKELKGSTKSKKTDLDSMENAEIEKKAKAFFSKKYYTKAIEYYSHLILKNYKPATSHFMIGQMKFKRKNYADAISFYKKSAALYSKASYMPELMLNTAISMHKTGDKKNAKAFFNGVISKYPKSSQAKSSKKYIK
ncbi:tetratricopeptide repeat protein [Sulfurimonas sp.]